ncbi:MAG: hypothetical protein AB7G28_26475 [Pirellulales bacterium]
MPREEKIVDFPAVPYDPAKQHSTTITVRMPHESHMALLKHARELEVSLNTLCVAKLMAAVADCQVWNPPRQEGRAERLRRELKAELEAEMRREQEKLVGATGGAT